jgi:hypothetical protein
MTSFFSSEPRPFVATRHRRALRAGAMACLSLAFACGGRTPFADPGPDPGGDGSIAWDSGATPPVTRPGTSADSGAGPVPSHDGGASAGDTGIPASSGPIFSGASTFVALFPIEDGAILVTSDGVRHVGRDGSSKTVWTSPREITAAAFDGTLLGIADKGILTTLDRSFATVITAELTESCVAAVIASGTRFVCSPATDWSHISYVFDLRSGRLVNTSAPTTYQGIRMQMIDGTDDFVTVTYGSPAHFDLHRLTTTSSIDFVGESPDHGAFPVSEVYAVVGTPGTHVLTETGFLLKIYHDADAGDAGPYPAPFFKDGALGTLGDSQAFVALDTRGGEVYGVVAARTTDNPLCGSGCWFQHVDVRNRALISSRVHKVAGNKILGFRHDAVTARTWLVTTPPGVDAWDPAPGFVVSLLED